MLYEPMLISGSVQKCVASYELNYPSSPPGIPNKAFTEALNVEIE